MANPLTLLMPIKKGVTPSDVIGLLRGNQAKIDAALTSIGTVHYARFLLLDRSSPTLQISATSKGPYVLGVITEFDGKFEVYVQAFVNVVGDIFDALLSLTSDGASLVPVSKHVKEFNAYITAHDLSQMPNGPGLFSAYDATVQKILGKL